MIIDTILKLGDFTFANFEIPEKITFGGEQKLVNHELIGGIPVFDAMGKSDHDLEWSGLFKGDNALLRARYIDGLRLAGKPLPLTWSEFAYRVIIKEFTADFQRRYQKPYTIKCAIVDNLTAPIKFIADPGIDSLIASDMLNAGDLVTAINDPILTGLFSTASTALSAIDKISAATGGKLNSVLAPISAVRAKANSMLTAIAPAITTADILSQVFGITTTSNLARLDSTLGRVESNITAQDFNSKVVTVAGGNLYKIAAAEYGDQSAWVDIARANSLSDPNITDVRSLTIPRNTSNSGGIL